MATNGTSIGMEPRLEEEIPGIQADYCQPLNSLDQTSARRRFPDMRWSGATYPRSADGADRAETAPAFALAPLVEKIAFGIAGGLIAAMEELENHIADETCKVGNAIERQLGMLQTSLTELSGFVKEQRSANLAVQDQLQQLSAVDASLAETDARQAGELDTLRAEARELSSSVAQRIETSTASLQESDARQLTELEALRAESRAFSSSVSERIDVAVASLREADERQATDLTELQFETRESNRTVTERIDSICKELGVAQEDVGAMKATLSSGGSRIDALVERLDRQADAVRLMHATYSQRETELEQVVDGLARLRAFPKQFPTNAL